ncbi:MAG: GDP-mannose 4,6-dehydratase [Acidobacteria bacterium]|nr:MAG: GDP-mannose 4,6-dehydratase [Acidobacteriota bacterium]
MKKALITGISGQDGSYLAEYLLDLGYEVWGLVRREPATSRWLGPFAHRIELVYGDLRDAESLAVAFQKAWPDELYNLAAQVFVPTSWEHPAETFDINAGGLSRLLQIVERQKPGTRVYQASTSEMFGNADGARSEQTLFQPMSPYGVSKMAAHRLVEVYRNRGLFVAAGILFNHESPRRGPEMVTRKITRAAARWALGDRTKLKLGNLHARRDWGFAGDYVKAMHAMLQNSAPKDYVVGTGISHSVEDFVRQTLKELSAICGTADVPVFEDWVEVDPRFLRTGEIHDLRADPSLAQKEFGWKPATDFVQLVRMMVRSDLALGRESLGTSERDLMMAAE